jgi:hypothetical protein
MAETKTAQAKTNLPNRCAEKIKQAQISPDSSVPIHLIGKSRTLALGNGVRPNDEIVTMAVHPHGVFVESRVAGVTHRLIIPAANLQYYELDDGE